MMKLQKYYMLFCPYISKIYISIIVLLPILGQTKVVMADGFGKPADIRTSQVLDPVEILPNSPQTIRPCFSDGIDSKIESFSESELIQDNTKAIREICHEVNKLNKTIQNKSITEPSVNVSIFKEEKALFWITTVTLIVTLVNQLLALVNNLSSLKNSSASSTSDNSNRLDSEDETLGES